MSENNTMFEKAKVDEAIYNAAEAFNVLKTAAPGMNLLSYKRQAEDVCMPLLDYAINLLSQTELDGHQKRDLDVLKFMQQELQDSIRETNRKLCEEGLEKGVTAINRVTAFLALDPEAEKRKDKRAYYEKCDNFSRLCDGVLRDLKELYRPCSNDPNVSTEFDHQIETLSILKNKLEALIG